MRRFLLFCVIVLACAASSPAEEVTVDAESVVRYVESCRKPNGAFGPQDQEYTDAAWNYAAVWTLRCFSGQQSPQPEAVLEHGLRSPAGHAGFGHQNFYHQHAIRIALGRAIAVKHGSVNVVHRGFKPDYYASPLGTSNDLLYKQPGGIDPRDAEADTFYYHDLASLHYLLCGLQMSGRWPAERQPLIDYILRRQAPCGGFVDVRNGDALPSDLEANVPDTMHAISSLAILLDNNIPSRDKIAAFLNSCWMKNGAFRSNPRHVVQEQDADVYDTWAAVRTYAQILRSLPEDRQTATVAWLNSLQNADGGFGDRAGWRSRLYSTFYAVESLYHLRQAKGILLISRKAITTKRLQKPETPVIADGEFGIYQAQFKMPVVTVDELDDLHKRKFNLLALKSDKFELVEPLLARIREKKLPMDVVLCHEAYPHRLVQTGGVVLNHVGNFTLDPRWTADERSVWQAADAAGREYLPWTGYRDQVVKPMAALGSFVYPEQDYEQQYAYSSYGTDRSGERGYNAVLVGFNWPPYDFVRVFPWREKYVDRLVPIADVDAHGDYKKWSNQLDFTRTLFIARGPTYADFQEAAKAGRVVTVIAKAEGVPSGATYYGPRPAVDYVRRHNSDWKWW